MNNYNSRSPQLLIQPQRNHNGGPFGSNSKMGTKNSRFKSDLNITLMSSEALNNQTSPHNKNDAFELFTPTRKA